MARLFTKLGFVAFGGPAAHVAMMRQEVVERQHWMDDQEFLDLNGATNLIPGPNSKELAIHIGRERAGWLGLLVAGTCFIVPAALIVLAFAVTYGFYGTTPAGRSLLYGITPVVVAIVAQALWGLLKTAVKGPSRRPSERAHSHSTSSPGCPRYPCSSGRPSSSSQPRTRVGGGAGRPLWRRSVSRLACWRPRRRLRWAGSSRSESSSDVSQASTEVPSGLSGGGWSS